MPVRERVGQVVDLFAMIGVVAGIMMLVSPRSRGPQLVEAMGRAWINAAGATIRSNPGTAAAPKVPKSSGGKKKSGGDGGGGGSRVPLFPFLPNIPGLTPSVPNPLDPDNWPDLNPFD